MDRRKLITGLISFIATPVIVRAASLMPVKAMEEELKWEWVGGGYGVIEGIPADMRALLKARLDDTHILMAKNLAKSVFGAAG